MVGCDEEQTETVMNVQSREERAAWIIRRTRSCRAGPVSDERRDPEDKKWCYMGYPFFNDPTRQPS